MPKKCIKRIHLVTDDGLFDRKAFYKVEIVSIFRDKFLELCHYHSTKLQIVGLQLYRKSTPLSLFKGFRLDCNLSIFFGILGMSISQNTFQLPLLTLVTCSKY